jgi:hypothetical protein
MQCCGGDGVTEMDRVDYVLTRGCRPVAVLREIGRDQPIVQCEFHTFPAFEAVRLVLQAHRDEDTWRALLRVRLLRLRLRSTDGFPTIRRLRLVVNGDEAAFRYAVGPVYRWRFRRWQSGGNSWGWTNPLPGRRRTPGDRRRLADGRRWQDARSGAAVR